MSAWRTVAALMRRIESPLRPTEPDLAPLRPWIDAAAERARGAGRACRVLVLGATPAYHWLPWPAGTEVVVADFSQAMLQQLWPGAPESHWCVDWLALDTSRGLFDLVIGDGWLCQLAWPAAQQAVVPLLHRVLHPGGVLVSRFFVLGEPQEGAAAAYTALQATLGRHNDLVKLRLWLALQRSPSVGIQARDGWRFLQQKLPREGDLADFLGETVEFSRWQTALYLEQDQRRFHFVTLAAVRSLFLDTPGGFEWVSIHTPPYELGRHCPTLVLRAKPAAAVL